MREYFLKPSLRRWREEYKLVQSEDRKWCQLCQKLHEEHPASAYDIHQWYKEDKCTDPSNETFDKLFRIWSQVMDFLLWQKWSRVCLETMRILFTVFASLLDKTIIHCISYVAKLVNCHQYNVMNEWRHELQSSEKRSCTILFIMVMDIVNCVRVIGAQHTYWFDLEHGTNKWLDLERIFHSVSMSM